MIKNLTLLILSFLFFQSAKAQKTTDTVLYYMKNSGVSVSTKDSADYLRLVISPQSNTDKDLFKVRDYYSNGKLKMVATSLNDKIPLFFDGNIINYFPDGKRKSTLEYINGRLSGVITTYYPNGELFRTIKMQENGDVSLVECRDSTGQVLALNGTGHVIVFDDDFKNIIEEGDIKDDKKNGEWRGLIGDTGRYVSVFRNGVHKSGTSYMKSGNQYTFKKIIVEPEYEGGETYLNIYLHQNMVYPEFAKEHHINGTVHVNFIVEKDGSITNVKIADTGEKIPSLDEEAVRLISSMPMWTPGKIYGIPMRIPYSVPVGFYY
jgi:TonB family protein